MKQGWTELDKLMSSAFSWAKSWHCSPTHFPLKLVVMSWRRATAGQDLRSAMSNPVICIHLPVSEGQWQGWAFTAYITTAFLINTYSKKHLEQKSVKSLEKHYFLAEIWHIERSMGYIYFPAVRHCRYISLLPFYLLASSLSQNERICKIRKGERAENISWQAPL